MDKLKILIAEDNSFSRKFYDTYISETVFAKQFAVNGFEALEIYGNWKPDIVLLDLMMPVMSGQEVLQNIRGSGRTLRPPSSSRRCPPTGTTWRRAPVTGCRATWSSRSTPRRSASSSSIST